MNSKDLYRLAERLEKVYVHAVDVDKGIAAIVLGLAHSMENSASALSFLEKTPEFQAAEYALEQAEQSKDLRDDATSQRP